jgi:DNA invertase Pin-like site-specific DNA recombinase
MFDRMTTAIGYIRVSTGEQPTSADVQEGAIRRECERRGWILVDTVRDLGESRRKTDRPGLAYALARMARSDADVMVSAALDRVGCSSKHLAQLHMAAMSEGWQLLFLDHPGLDMSTPHGRFEAEVRCASSNLEVALISQRTREALAELRAQGKRTGLPGVHEQAELSTRIKAMSASGMSTHAICNVLNSEGIPTVRGGKVWRPSALQVILGYRRPSQRRAA